jgi:hypothetical protein
VDEEAVASAVHEAGRPQHLKVLGGVRLGQAEFLGQRVHRALALGQKFEDFEPMGAGERLADPGVLPVQAVLEAASRLDCGHVKVINILLD